MQPRFILVLALLTAYTLAGVGESQTITVGREGRYEVSLDLGGQKVIAEPQEPVINEELVVRWTYLEAPDQEGWCAVYVHELSEPSSMVYMQRALEVGLGTTCSGVSSEPCVLGDDLGYVACGIEQSGGQRCWAAAAPLVLVNNREELSACMLIFAEFENGDLNQDIVNGLKESGIGEHDISDQRLSENKDFAVDSSDKLKLNINPSRPEPDISPSRPDPKMNFTGLKLDINPSRPEPKMNFTGLEPDISPSRPEPKMNFTGLEPDISPSRPDPKMNFTGVEPDISPSRPDPKMNFTGLEPDISPSRPDPKMNFTGLEPDINPSRPEPKMNFTGLEPDISPSRPVPKMNFTGVEPDISFENLFSNSTVIRNS